MEQALRDDMEAEGDALKVPEERGFGKLLSPVDRTEEVEVLAEAGADELYGGVIPDSWQEGSVAVNRRSFPEAQFPDEHSFALGIKKANALGLPFHLTLNAPFYHPGLHEELLALADRALGWGAAGIIVGDPGLLARLGDRHPEALLTLSTMAGVMNHEAINFFRVPGLARVVLPRHLSLAEMASIVAGTPGFDFEAFILVGKCPNEEAYCTFQHSSPGKRWPCELSYRLYSGETREEADDALPAVSGRKSWMCADRRMGCGLCALGHLKNLGVKIFKLVGRGGPTRGKVANIKLARKYLALGGGGLDARADYEERFGRRCVREICYFPELFRP